jgi:hypothetical protein
MMNPTLPQRVVDQAMADDMAAAKSEYMGEFRDDVGLFLPRAPRLLGALAFLATMLLGGTLLGRGTTGGEKPSRGART